MRKCSPPRRPSPWPLSLPTSWVKTCVNPKGILQQSPGLRGTSYPGSIASGRANPNGVESVGGKRGRNPVGVETRFARFPRVARRLATLGWRAQSLRDWARWQSGLVGHGKPWPTQRRGAPGIGNPRFSIFNFLGSPSLRRPGRDSPEHFPRLVPLNPGKKNAPPPGPVPCGGGEGESSAAHL